MKISNRLEAIAKFVKNGDSIIDIGCDHALLDIYLMSNKKKIKIIASDIHEGAIKNAKKNIEKYNLTSKIDLRLGNGLEVVEKNEINTIVISGMGYLTIKEILSNSEKMENVRKIVIQSNTDIVKLRKFIIGLGFKISSELLVKDNEIIYTVIEFIKGMEKYSYKELYFGPKILEKKNDEFYEYYNKKLLKYENLLLQLPKYEIKSRIHHRYLIKIIKKELSN